MHYFHLFALCISIHQKAFFVCLINIKSAKLRNRLRKITDLILCQKNFYEFIPKIMF